MEQNSYICTNLKGYHLAIGYKLQRHVDSKRHITGHVYVDGPRSRNVTGTKFSKEKDDAAPKAKLSKKTGQEQNEDQDETKKRAIVKKPKPLDNPAWSES
ncbi:hypothetical protein E4U59_006254 [Claviceps monticola]|nr:hypothetical protein E4U59_006254 [Claviceps monticola]